MFGRLLRIFYLVAELKFDLIVLRWVACCFVLFLTPIHLFYLLGVPYVSVY